MSHSGVAWGHCKAELEWLASCLRARLITLIIPSHGRVTKTETVSDVTHGRGAFSPRPDALFRREVDGNPAGRGAGSAGRPGPMPGPAGPSPSGLGTRADRRTVVAHRKRNQPDTRGRRSRSRQTAKPRAVERGSRPDCGRDIATPDAARTLVPQAPTLSPGSPPTYFTQTFAHRLTPRVQQSTTESATIRRR